MHRINPVRIFFHVIGGLFAAVVAALLPHPDILIVAGTFFAIGIGLEILRSVNAEFRELFRQRFSIILKTGEQGALLGYTWVVSATFLLAFLEDWRAMALGMIIWAFGDPAAVLAGRLIPHARSILPGKTLEGSLAFFLVATLVSALFLLFTWNAAPLLLPALLGGVGALTELFSRRISIDDNFSIPLTVGIVSSLFFAG
jgi:dolichol kinase